MWTSTSRIQCWYNTYSLMYFDYDYIYILSLTLLLHIHICLSSNLILLISMPIHGRAAFKGLLSFAPSIIHRTLGALPCHRTLHEEASVLSNFCSFCPIPLLWKLKLIDFLTLESLLEESKLSNTYKKALDWNNREIFITKPLGC